MFMIDDSLSMDPVFVTQHVPTFAPKPVGDRRRRVRRCASFGSFKRDRGSILRAKQECADLFAHRPLDRPLIALRAVRTDE